MTREVAVTVTLVPVKGSLHPQKVMAIEHGRLVPFLPDATERRQDCVPAYVVTAVKS